MLRRSTARFCVLVAVSGCVALSGCGTPSFDSFLPDVWPTGLEAVFDQPAGFAEPTQGEIVSAAPGATIDALGSLVGCWGGYAPEFASGEEGSINLYQSFSFREDGTFSWSILNEIPGVLPLIFVQEGNYEVVAPNTVRLLDATITAYAPSSSSYVPLTDDPPVDIELLATRDGDLLRLEHADADAGSDSFGIIPILRKFNCE